MPNSQNVVHLCHITKIIRYWRLQFEVKHVIVWKNIRYYPRSEVNSLGTLNAKFPALSHAWITLYSTSENQGCQKTSRFTAEVRPTSPRQNNFNQPAFGCYPLIFCQFTLYLKLIHKKYENNPSSSKQSTYFSNEWTILLPTVILTA